jgi:hypothetical protein
LFLGSDASARDWLWPPVDSKKIVVATLRCNCIDELLPSHVVVRVKRQLHQFHVVLNEARVLQFTELPGVTMPGGDARVGFGGNSTSVTVQPP